MTRLNGNNGIASNLPSVIPVHTGIQYGKGDSDRFTLRHSRTVSYEIDIQDDASVENSDAPIQWPVSNLGEKEQIELVGNRGSVIDKIVTRHSAPANILNGSFPFNTFSGAISPSVFNLDNTNPGVRSYAVTIGNQGLWNGTVAAVGSPLTFFQTALPVTSQGLA